MPKLRPYPSYRDSGIDYLGEVPSGWRPMRLGRVSQINPPRGLMIRMVRSDEPVTFLAMESISTTGRLDTSVKRPLVDVSSGFTYFERGDVVVAKITPCFENGKGACLDPDNFKSAFGFGTTELIVLRPSTDVLSRYLYLVTTMADFRQQGAAAMTGSAGQQRVPATFIRNYCVALPPLVEQAAIVAFLGQFDRRIGRLIRAKRRQIELLNEQKQAIIQQAVTRGLDPNVRLKPSGIEWLGNVPEHWIVKPAKYFYREVDERSVIGGEELLSVSHLTGVTPRSQKNVTMFMAASYEGYKICQPRDLVINTMWAWMGALGVSRQTGIVSTAYAVYRPTKQLTLSSTYVEHLLRSRPYVDEYVCRSTGIQSSRLRLYPDKFLAIPLILPPYDEQVKSLSINW